MRKVADFFDISEFPFKDLFDGVEDVWDALGRINGYLKRIEGRRIEGRVHEGAFLEGDGIHIGPESVVEPGAMIIGPALIGRGSVIRQGAYLRGDVIVGDGAVIGHTSEAKNTILLNGAKASHFAYIGDSILGNGVNLGAGTKLANFKVDTGKRGITVTVDGQKVETGRRKMGAILGDGAELGCNSVTMPGTLIGPGAIVYPCCVVRGAVAPNNIVKLRQELDYAVKK